jgi:NAD+ kinase
MTPRIQRVGIVAKHGLLAAAEHLTRIGAWLRERKIEVVFETETARLTQPADTSPTRSREELPSCVDVIVLLGGDGTLLAMASRIAQAGRDIPILGVNFGGLGFLTELRIDELFPALEAVVNGTATYDERLMLAATASVRHKADQSRVVLNDVVFTKGPLSRMIELSVSVNGRFVTRVKADGLIIASATGSTAYTLAAGGPIVHPSVDALVLTPIAPHTLTNRPVVIPGDADIEVHPEAPGGSDDVFVTYDGQYGYAIQPGDVSHVCKAKQALRLVKAPERGYFELLREKLKWGER